MSAFETTTNHQREIDSRDRFKFGENWTHFLKVLDENRINEATESLKIMLEVEDLNGKTFLDVGSGSGLFSLAAKRLGAKVFSFDYDPKSVACTNELKKQYFNNDQDWVVNIGSILDTQYITSIGKFDFVYSWGVLHHTGDMWRALNNIDLTVAEGGKLFLAIYNYQPIASKYWTFVKKTFNNISISRPLFIFIHGLYPTFPSILFRLLQNRKYPRGMSVWYDLKDWLGGYPFEVSRPEDIFEYYKSKSYNLEKLKTVGGKQGCNEYVFQKKYLM